MKINNGFNVLPWYDSLDKQNCKKWYTYGQTWPLLCPQGSILPFQFISDTAISISSNIYAINAETKQTIDLGIKPAVIEVNRADITYYIVKLASTSIVQLPIGRYNFRMNTSEGFLYSEEVSVIDNANKCIKVEYWNEDTLRFTSGEINFADDFHFILYVNSTVGKPEYEFEEELTKRLGYKFIESQTSNKVYKFSFVAPEYVCDAMRLIRMCDYIKLTTKFDSYNALSFAYEPKWQEQGDLAAVDVEFDTDCIIQKLESFNRRVKESFYNALLADIDEPVLFSTDTVAQYYTEYTSVATINGKLIRQLNAIGNEELKGSLNSIVLPIDNQSDTSQEAKKVFLQDILGLVDTVSKLFRGHYDEAGNLLWIEALANMGVNGGVTMFINNGSLSLPTVAEGLPFDQKTIWYNPTTKQIEVIGGTGGGTAGAVAWDNIIGKPTWIGSTKPTYNYSEIQGTPDLSKYALASDIPSLSGYATQSWVDGNFVTLTTQQTISGEKNFTGGLKVNGSPIVYDATNKYWKLEGDLLVTGGVTMYANEGTYTPSTIMDALFVDNTNLKVVDGVLTFVGSTGGASTMGSLTNVGSWADSVAPQDRIMYQAANSSQWVAKNLSDLAVGGVTGNYLPLSGGIISNTAYAPLTIHRDNGPYGTAIKFTNVGDGVIGYIGVRGSGNADYPLNPIFENASGIYKIWHSGNDGSGSGLDADLLDGKQYSDIINGNVASATKLQTARTIFGQPFDGTGNVNGIVSSTTTTGGVDAGLDANGTSYRLFFGVGSGDVNRGIYDKTNASWWIYRDGTTNTLIPQGAIGLGTTSPKGQLHIIQSAWDNGIVIDRTITGGGSAISVYSNGTYIGNFGINGAQKFEVNKISSGTASVMMSVDSSGNGLFVGGVTMYSDARKKTILNHVELSLKEIAEAPLIEHYYNSDEKKTTHVGSIAQYWAGLNDWFCKKDSEGFYTMEIQNAALASAISVARELVKFETETDRRIRLLEEENEKLKKEIEILKWNIA